MELPAPFNGKPPVYVSVEPLRGIHGVPKRKGLRLARTTLLDGFEDLCFKGDEPKYASNMIELISGHKPRAELILSDGDTIEFALV